tara:strand:- start:5 stop:745 length:741 start_codon:yes stop_codon:yes gene_type:complete
MNSISPNLNIMIRACEKASKILIRDFGEIENLQVSKKGPTDFVTNADEKVEKILIEELLKSKKNFSVLSEEAGEINNADKKNIWIIDPIDGTTNFLHGVPHFSISIALKSHDEIVSGLIFDPIKNEMFFAEKNNGAYYNNHRIRVSKKNKLDECLFATNSIGIEKTKLNARVTGSAALDLAYVGAGRFDGYFQNNLNIWDIAAGILIVSEAGGKIKLSDNLKTKMLNIVASSIDIHDKMVEKLINF